MGRCSWKISIGGMRNRRNLRRIKEENGNDIMSAWGVREERRVKNLFLECSKLVQEIWGDVGLLTKVWYSRTDGKLGGWRKAEDEKQPTKWLRLEPRKRK